MRWLSVSLTVNSTYPSPETMAFVETARRYPRLEAVFRRLLPATATPTAWVPPTSSTGGPLRTVRVTGIRDML
jgi:hypothetical protein